MSCSGGPGFTRADVLTSSHTTVRHQVASLKLAMARVFTPWKCT